MFSSTFCYYVKLRILYCRRTQSTNPFFNYPSHFLYHFLFIFLSNFLQKKGGDISTWQMSLRIFLPLYDGRITISKIAMSMNFCRQRWKPSSITDCKSDSSYLPFLGVPYSQSNILALHSKKYKLEPSLVPELSLWSVWPITAVFSVYAICQCFLLLLGHMGKTNTGPFENGRKLII